MDSIGGGSSRSGRGRRSTRHNNDYSFTSYLSFGYQTSICLGIFLGVYCLILLAFAPLLQQQAPSSATLRHGQVLKPVVAPLMDKVKQHVHVLPGHELAEGVAEEVSSAVRKRLDLFRHQEGLTDAQLLEQAAADLEKIRSERMEKSKKKKQHVVMNPAPVAPGKRTGFMVLGMHRSGTSMLSGLLATGLGYKTGGPLIGGAFDNVKGFFERLDVVYQNDEFMNHQQVWWSSNVANYDHQKALDMKDAGTVTFTNGKKALAFFSNPHSVPWLQKDPRMCITLKTWLPLLSSSPAIVFTYRDPLQVARSLSKREANFSVEHGLRLWILYNKAAVQNSAGLCRVLSSNEAILANPLEEVKRISHELTSKCGVPSPPDELTQEAVDRFVDPGLQHNKDEKGETKVLLKDFGNDCVANEYKSDHKEGSPALERERELYLRAMQVFCDFKTGKAYEESYVWPEIPK